MELPDEDAEEGLCGKLVVSVCGTRGAASNWKKRHRGALQEDVFNVEKCRTVYCVPPGTRFVFQRARGGGDSTALVDAAQLRWHKGDVTGGIEANVKGVIGPERTDGKSLRLSNTIVQWADSGIRYMGISETRGDHCKIMWYGKCK